MKDKLLRKIIPSVTLLARTPVASLLDILDYFIKLKHKEWSHLPPASLRMRIGVGNKLLHNHYFFIESGNAIVQELNVRGYLNSGSHILELGCGCGRHAIALMKFLGEYGSYIGQDVDKEMINWCRNHLINDRFKFYDADIFNSVYNPTGGPVDKYEFPANDNSISLIISDSVFTHMLYKEFCHYLAQCNRVLSNNRYLHMTLFLMDFIKGRLNNRWSFSYKLDNCYVESLKYPEAAVAYELEVVKKILSKHNFSVCEIYKKEGIQQTIVAKKDDSAMKK